MCASNGDFVVKTPPQTCQQSILGILIATLSTHVNNHAPWACLLLPWLVIWGRSCSMGMPPPSLAGHLGSSMLHGHASFFPGWSSGVVHAPWACLLLPWLVIWGHSCSMGMPPSSLAGHLGSFMLHGHASFFPG